MASQLPARYAPPPILPQCSEGSREAVMPRSVRKWDGGYVRKDERGREVYTIRRMINGKRYDVSTRAHTERAALEQLKRFEADPEGYDARGVLRPDPIYL